MNSMKYEMLRRVFLLCLFIVGLFLYIGYHDAFRDGIIRPSLGRHFIQDKRTETIDNGTKFVLILTYMRSGSSLTGDIMQQHPQSYYHFEPIYAFRSANINTTVKYINGSSSPPPFNRDREIYDILYNYFTCDLTKLPTGVFTAPPFTEKGLKSKQWTKCVGQRKKPFIREKIINCTQKLQNVCEESKIRVIKTIRTKMTTARLLMEKLPNLKIIHLVRDPRSVLNSRNHVGVCPDKQACTDIICRTLENDLIEEEYLMKEYPDRILPVLYENLARYPIETARSIYDFVGYEFTEKISEYVYNNTMAGEGEKGAYSVKRANSSEHIDIWKKQMPPDFQEYVNNRCNYVIKRYKFDNL